MSDEMQGSGTKKSGGCFKWGLIGCGGIVVLGVLAVGGVSWWAMSKLQTDPATVEATAQEILPLEKPANLKGKMGFSMFGIKMAVLTYGVGPTEGIVLTLMQGPAGMTEGAFQETMEERTEEGKAEVVERRESESFLVEGRPVVAEVHVMANDEGKQYLQYVMVFPRGGKSVMVALMGALDLATHDYLQGLLDTVGPGPKTE